MNRQGKTLVIIPPPGEFVIGSPPNEEGREGGPEGEREMQQFTQVDYEFAMMSHQVTVAEFLEFRQDFPYRKHFSPEPACPINNVSWYDSVAYCNWLNEKEGVPRDEWCYLPNEQDEYAEGMTIVPNCLHRKGYRLPTETEWEFACRAGSITGRYYGQSWDLDNHYACNVQNSMGRQTTKVGSFKPNDLGLFDMLGNVVDWCHTAFCDRSKAVEIKCAGDLPEVVSNNPRRVLMSTSFVEGMESFRTAKRGGYPPNARVYGTSLRVSRTCALADHPDMGEEVKNSQPRLVRGSTSFQGPGQTRNSYRTIYPPNFGNWGYSFRTARTMH